MNQRKKKQSAYFLLMVTLFLTVGSYAVLYVLEFNIKMSVQVMLDTLPYDKLQLIEMPYTEDAEEKHEIVSGGRFYDVVSYEISNQTISFFCYFDEAETDLVELSACLFDETNFDYNKNLLTQLLRITDVKYLSPTIFLPVHLNALQVHYSPFHFSTSTHQSDVCTPPPQFFI